MPYAIVLKYFGVFSIAFKIIKTPYWSAFTEAYHKGDLDWIKSSVKSLTYLWFCGVFGVVVLALSFNIVKEFWVGPDVLVDSELILQCALFVLLQAYTSIYTQFLNGVGKVRVSLITSLFTLVFNVPMSYFFAVKLNLNAAGVLMATNISFCLYLVTRMVQYQKIINNRATGIWAK